MPRRTFTQERAEILAYLRAQEIPDAVDETEEHFNACLAAIVDDIERGKHLLFARGEL